MRFLILLLFSIGLYSNPISRDCRYNGIFLSGKVRVVNANEDFKVRIVKINENLRVRKTGGEISNSCGRWHFIKYGIENFKVRFVNANEDFTISYTSVNEGLPFP